MIEPEESEEVALWKRQGYEQLQEGLWEFSEWVADRSAQISRGCQRGSVRGVCLHPRKKKAIL